MLTTFSQIRANLADHTTLYAKQPARRPAVSRLEDPIVESRFPRYAALAACAATGTVTIVLTGPAPREFTPNTMY